MRYLIVMGMALGIISGQPAWADTIVDTFEDRDPNIWPLVVNSGNPVVTNSQSGLTGVIGGVRVGGAVWESGPLNVSVDIPVPGFFGISSDVLTDGMGSLSYPGVGGLNLDLTDPHGTGTGGLAGAAFIIEVVSSDLGGVPIDVTLTDGSTTSATASGVAAGGGTVSIPLSDFTGIDFSDIDQIDVAFDPGLEFDITVDFIGFDWPEVTPEPEPASILVWSLVGVIGIVVGRRFRGRRR